MAVGAATMSSRLFFFLFFVIINFTFQLKPSKDCSLVLATTSTGLPPKRDCCTLPYKGIGGFIHPQRSLRQAVVTGVVPCAPLPGLRAFIFIAHTVLYITRYIIPPQIYTWYLVRDRSKKYTSNKMAANIYCMMADGTMVLLY